MTKRDIGKLELVISGFYKRNINVVSHKPLVKLPVSPGEEHSQLVADFVTGKDMVHDVELLQALLDDLCRQRRVKEDDYLIYFQDN